MRGSQVEINGEGIYGLIETALSIGRHYRWPERQSIATLIPDIFALNLVIEESSAMVLSELTAEISQIARTSGFSFSVERMTIEDEIAVVSANYITADWKYKHRVMNVSTFEKISDGLETLLREIGETKRMAYVTENIHCSGDQAHLSCICYTLNNLVHDIFDESCDTKHNVSAILTACQKIAAAIAELGFNRWVDPPAEKRAGRLDYLFYGYELLKYVQECMHYFSIIQNPDILVLLQSVDWSTVDEIRKYLEPF
ncbi:unnamed protein product, partial [Gongylonema pulchrum]|uniref:Exocyst complex component Sec8 n=1 Tax=Gongylonema pulchrum TaxID=637853 RepID=A0A183EM30_9BILA